jgi:hypothetical protein
LSVWGMMEREKNAETIRVWVEQGWRGPEDLRRKGLRRNLAGAHGLQKELATKSLRRKHSETRERDSQIK